MRNSFLLLMCLVLAVQPMTIGYAAETPPAADWTRTVDPTTDNEPTAEPKLSAMKTRDGLTRRERRDMGLTFRNIRRAMATMQASGEIDETMTKAEISIAVADKLVSDNPSAFQDPSLDWDAILAFIERMIPLILKLIALFS